MANLKSDPPPENESEIVWLEDIEQFDYVREYLHQFAKTRQRPIPWNGADERIVGYSVLCKDARSWSRGYFARRVFAVRTYDRSDDPEGTYKKGTPCEAVDPRTIAPNKWGEQTERSWGGPLSQPMPSGNR